MSSKRVMNKQENRLLLKVICETMPYGIIVHRKSDNRDLEFMYADPMENMDHFVHCFDCQSELDDMKLYLRPMSSMTEDEKTCLEEELCTMYNGGVNTDYESFGIEILATHPWYGDSFRQDFTALDWLNAHHFDYRGLIEMGLALEAPENMYG